MYSTMPFKIAAPLGSSRAARAAVAPGPGRLWPLVSAITSSGGLPSSGGGRRPRDVHVGSSTSIPSPATRRQDTFESSHPDAIRRRKEREERKARREAERALSSSPVEASNDEGEWWQAGGGVIKDVLCEADLVKAIAMAGGTAADPTTTVLVVEFYAPWCNGCKAMYPRLCRMARDNPDVRFVKVSGEHCMDVCKALDVPKLPWFHIYLGAHGKVAEFTANVADPQGAIKLQRAINAYSAPMCAVGDIPEVEGLGPVPTVAGDKDGHFDHSVKFFNLN